MDLWPGCKLLAEEMCCQLEEEKEEKA